MPEVNVCGTGGWTGPLPGDPDNSISLSATSTFGGISVSWTYPTVNSHAVAHTLLYRGTTNNFAASIERGVVAGNTFFDRVEASVLYYYWIRVVSVYGTVGDLIGPASATSRELSTDVVEILSGQISAGVLATSLRTDIDRITLNYSELTAEIAARLAGDSALSSALADVQSGVTASMAFISSEITTRTNGQNALASQINTIGTLNAANIAAITTEQTARVAADSALASSITTVQTATNNNTSALITETSARTTADSALASSITTAQSTLNGSISSVQVTLQTNINTVSGVADTAKNKADALGALYTVQVSSDGLVGGFGIYNNGATIEAGFEVDTFWIGRSASDKVLPFIVSDGVVYMDVARIKDADIGTLKIAGNAVTVPAGAYTAGEVSRSNGSGAVLAQSLSVSPNGGKAIIGFSCTGGGPQRESYAFSLYRGGTLLVTIGAGSNEEQRLAPGATAFTYIDESPGTSPVTYYVYLNGNGDYSACSFRSLTYIEAKR